MHTNNDFEMTFWARTERTSGCWRWQAGRSAGYGYCRYEGRAQPAHRVSYRLRVGDIPAEGDWTVHHLCFERSCVRPDHLVLRTRAENSREAYVRCLKPWQDERRRLRENQVVPSL